jgi:predicted RNase H-like nuclease (RuvC/YqgF family)
VLHYHPSLNIIVIIMPFTQTSRKKAHTKTNVSALRSEARGMRKKLKSQTAKVTRLKSENLELKAQNLKLKQASDNKKNGYRTS